MSFLIIKKAGQLVKKKLLDVICNKNQWSEIGIIYNLPSGVLRRAVGFKNLDQLDIYLAKTVGKGAAAIIYVNDHENAYEEVSYSPLLVSPDWGYASCGNMLTLNDKFKGKSNNEVFLDQILKTSLTKYPDIIESEPFIHLIKTTARAYIALAFIRKDGHLVLINSKLFDEIDGIKYADFAANKREVLKPTVGFGATTKTTTKTAKGSRTVYSGMSRLTKKSS